MVRSPFLDREARRSPVLTVVLGAADLRNMKDEHMPGLKWNWPIVESDAFENLPLCASVRHALMFLLTISGL